MRDYSGQERSIIASAIASGSPIPAEGWSPILGFRARVAVLWDELQNLTADTDTNPLIVEAMNGAQQKYFKDFISLSDQMKKISDAGGKYPMNAAGWVDATTPQIGSLLNVLYAAAKASEALAGDAADHSLRELLATIALLVLGVAIVAVSLRTVIARVTRPLTRTSRPFWSSWRTTALSMCPIRTKTTRSARSPRRLVSSKTMELPRSAWGRSRRRRRGGLRPTASRRWPRWPKSSRRRWAVSFRRRSPATSPSVSRSRARPALSSMSGPELRPCARMSRRRWEILSRCLARSPTAT